ncbi:ArsR/SmtB family transcription factor [Marinisporobacter balticus]|uniref:ArsR family transcriptional regulator n=1 Tax=Marinisporobacter balticus TaxID=2018667 RepID=A0A4R2KK56_9FIRM|nr:metalloregulator ArsR/SmtB family transcription factor [Marinisporobacter balticus]TCO74361.1 ArsR family transcriptional regulator [Marinisporobacter balticus]
MKELVEICKALSDENRITIFKRLAYGELCVCDILENLNLSQPTVSHHLKVLYQADLIHVEKRGKWKYYSINNEKVIETKQFFEMILNRSLDIEIKHCDSDCDGTR